MVKASPNDTYKVGECVFCKSPVYYNEDEDRYIFTGRRHCECVRWEDEDRYIFTGRRWDDDEVQADFADSDSRYPER